MKTELCSKAHLALAVGFLVSACQGTPPPTYAAAAPVAAPIAKPTVAPISQTKTTGTTTVSADGSTITTEQTTTTVGFNPAKPATAVAAAPVAAAYSGLTGTWKMISSSNGATCNVALYGAPTDVSGKAGSDCPFGFILNGVTGWNYENGQMALQKGAETVLTLNQLGASRFDGVATSGILSTTITLKR